MSVDKVRGYNYHPWAVCITTDCQWEHRASDQTRRLAKEHVEIRGHHVQVVQENHDHYAPSDYEFAVEDKTDEELARLNRGMGIG